MDFLQQLFEKEIGLSILMSLEKAQLGGSKDDYEQIITEAINRSLDIYLKALKGEE